MYNSFFVSFFAFIWSYIDRLYKMSFTRKIFRKLGRNSRKFYNNSIFSKIYKKAGIVFKNSVFYKFFKGIFRLVDIVLNALKSFFGKITKSSEIRRDLGYYSKDMTRGFEFVYELLIFLGIFLIILKLMGSNIALKMPVIFIFVGFLGTLINGLEIVIIKESKILNFFLDLFRLDKGGEEWW